MSPADGDTLPMGFADSALPVTEPALAPASGLPSGLLARRLVAAPWRHAGLVALCAIAGAMASALFWLAPAPAPVAAARPHVQAIEEAPLALRLDLEPGPGVDHVATTLPAELAQAASRALRLDDMRPLDEIDAALRDAPPAAGVLAPSERARPTLALAGLAAGLLFGLLVAARRELVGPGMRSPREAEWALGAPVLGAIPTLSAKAREALLATADAA